MKNLCVFVSMDNSEGHILDDSLCRPHLEALGWTLEEWAWTHHHDWARAGVVVFRSCYDYWERLPEFRSFLDSLEAVNARVFNDLRAIRWNLDKSYLFELEDAQIPIVPSRLVTNKTQLNAALEVYSETDEFVLKPCIGAGGFEMSRFTRNQAEVVEVAEASLLQPFLPTINRGEWSVIFFGQDPSHAVLKVAKEGEYRIQDTHGGTTKACEITPQLELASKKVMEALLNLGHKLPLYSRFDFVGDPEDGSLLLMEVELLEPSLFLSHSDGSAERFAKALDQFSHSANS